jgi:AHBA synthesis associated protein
VIFDLDGTLIDSEPVMSEAFAQAASSHGVDQPDVVYEKFRMLSGRPLTEIVGTLGLAPGFADTFRAISLRFAHRTRMFDGVADMLRDLRSHQVSMAILTGKERDRTEYILDLLDIRHYFSVLVTGTDPVPPKPDAASVEFILKTLACPADEACYVGDGLVDLAAARGAGVQAIMCLWGVATSAQLAVVGATCVVSTVAQLRAELAARSVFRVGDEAISSS